MNVACALCQKKTDLRKSHIVPAFFGEYLKETSATGYLRGVDSPNLRIQDLTKTELLCAECEQRLSVWEKNFAQGAFKRVQDDSFRELEYGPWLLSFLVSLSWRVLAVERGTFVRDYPEFSAPIEAAFESWRQFLLGKRKHPGSEHHLFVIPGIPERVPAGSHEKTLHYLLRAIDAGIGSGKRTLFVYTKALRSLVFSPIVPGSPAGWTNTRVHAGTGRLVSPQKIAMPGFGDFLMSRVGEAFEQPLSEKQRARIAETMLQQPGKALQSESYKVHQATKRLIHPAKRNSTKVEARQEPVQEARKYTAVA